MTKKYNILILLELLQETVLEYYQAACMFLTSYAIESRYPSEESFFFSSAPEEHDFDIQVCTPIFGRT